MVVNKFVECFASVVLEDIYAILRVRDRNLKVREAVVKNVHLSGITAIGDRYKIDIKQSKFLVIP